MEVSILKKECNKLVVKHNKLIEFKGQMTTNELKLFSLIVADIGEQQKDQFQRYSIDISALKETTKDKNFYEYISDVAFKLENKRIIIEKLNEKGKKYRTSIRLINKPEITDESKDLVLHIDKDLIPYISDLKREFTRYEIENILRLSSNYSIRLYELLKQYENIKKREFKLEDLKEFLGLERDQYSRIYDFERWVLKVAKEEINKHTDLVINYEKLKTGRRITSILFIIKAKNQDKEIYIDFLNEFYDIKDMKFKMGLKNENFSPTQIMELYEMACEKADNEDIDLFEYIRLNYNHIKGKARNKYSYLLNALENDYASAIGQINLDYYIKK